MIAQSDSNRLTLKSVSCELTLRRFLGSRSWGWTSWQAFDLDCFYFLEVFAVVGEDGEVEVESGASYHEIEVADLCSLELQSAAFSTEQSANLVVQTDDFQVAQKLQQVKKFRTLRVSRAKNAVIKFCDGD